MSASQLGTIHLPLGKVYGRTEHFAGEVSWVCEEIELVEGVGIKCQAANAGIANFWELGEQMSQASHIFAVKVCLRYDLPAWSDGSSERDCLSGLRVSDIVGNSGCQIE